MGNNKKCEIPYWTSPNNLDFKAVKSKDGQVTIEGFANKNVVDRGNDRIEPGAFDLTNFNKNPIMFFNHDPMLEIGAVTEVKKTDEGLFIKGLISNSDDDFTKRVRNNIKQGILRSFSVGFDLHDEEKDGDGVNVIKSAELMEVSIVGIPMNQDSQFSVSSKGDSKQRACKMLDLMEKQHRREKLLEEEKEAEKGKEQEQGKEQQQAENEDVNTDGKAEERKLLLEGRTGPSSAEGDEHRHVVQLESSTNAGTATTLVGEGDSHTHDIKDGEVQAGGEDNHTHSLDLDSLAAPESEAVADEETTDKGEHEDEAEEKQEPTTVQTLIFSKEKFPSKDEAISWAKEHDFSFEKIDENEDSFRLRQRDTSDFKEDSFKTISITEGISAVIGKLREEDSEDLEKTFSQIIITKIAKEIYTTDNADIDEIVMQSVEEIIKTKNIKITKNHYRIYFTFADKILETKQADQEQIENIPTTPVKTDRNEDDFGSPALDMMKQTNVLLGALINEMQQLRSQVAQLSPQQEAAKQDEEEDEPDLENEDEKAGELSESQNNDNIDSEEAGRAERALLDVSKKYIDKLQKRLRKLGV